ncbi:MAG: hypothetical protein ABSF90_12530 [Syntrophobacteraceae bacterium]|jgi:hypothetical protein
MPKRMADYTLADWSRLRPLTQNYKTLRYRLLNAVYMRRRPLKGNLGELAGYIRDKNVLVTIAFSDPQVIEWQAQLMRAYVSRPLFLIADNSDNNEAAAVIETIAERHGAPYVRLPTNPWGPGSRSHGISLNWVWRNIIRPGQPEAFGFLDHDLFPTAPDDPFAALSTQDFYGQVRTAGPRWFLWAGFCVFRFESVRHKPLDFGQDWFLGLDTGGGNWEVLYRHVNRAALLEPACSEAPFRPGLDIKDGPFQWFGTWVHEVRHAGRIELAGEKREHLGRLLAPHLAAARARFAVRDPNNALEGDRLNTCKTSGRRTQ